MQQETLADVGLGSLADMALLAGDFCFTPKSDINYVPQDVR
jgi:hypothetical protein